MPVFGFTYSSISPPFIEKSILKKKKAEKHLWAFRACSYLKLSVVFANLFQEAVVLASLIHFEGQISLQRLLLTLQTLKEKKKNAHIPGKLAGGVPNVTTSED